MRSRLRPVAAALAHPLLPLASGVLAALLMLSVLDGGFQLDDHYQRFRLLGLGEPAFQLFVFYDGDPVRNQAMMEAGSIPWWSAPELRHANFRYLSVATMQLDFLLWPERPAVMHLHSVMWMAALAVAVALLYRQVLGATWVAGLAALLYAVDEAHAVPVAYLANRNALIATCFGVLCLWSYTRWSADGWRFGGWLAPACLALALAGGEIAVATAAYLFAHAVFLDRGSILARGKALLPCGAVFLAWAAFYKLGSFGAAGSGFYRDPLGDPGGFASGLIWRVPALLLGQWTPVPADLASEESGRVVLAVAGAVASGVILLAMLPLLRRDPVARFWGLGSLLSLVPVAATGPANRLLFFVGVGAMPLIVLLLRDLLADRPGARHRVGRVAAWAVMALLLLVHGVVAPLAIGPVVAYHERVAVNLQRALDSVPRGSALASQSLVVVNPPDYTYTVGTIGPALAADGGPVPGRLRALSAGTSEVEVERVDAHTLRVRLPEGLFPTLFSRYYRGRDVPFAVGDRVILSDVSAEVTHLAPGGDPDVILYRFDVPLEDRSLRWLRWRDGEYVAWAPPALGGSETLEPSASIFSP